MDEVYWLLAVGNIILFFGTLLLIRSVIKNRYLLYGFDLVGSFLTLVPVCMFMIAFVYMGNWISVFFSIFTVAFWALVFMFKLRSKFRGKQVYKD